MRRVATIESIGSSTRIEGARLTELLRAGCAYVSYASLESVIEENKDLCYAGLHKTQSTLTQAKPNREAWLLFFLRCLKTQKDNLAARLQRERLLTHSLAAALRHHSETARANTSG